MNQTLNTRALERYIGLDVHPGQSARTGKHYITVGGMNAGQELVLRPRDVEMQRFRAWAEQNLRPMDIVVLPAPGAGTGGSYHQHLGYL